MKKLIPLVACIMFFAACKKESEELDILPISDYAPLAVGKYITYSLDSLVYTNFGAVEAHRFYEVKYFYAFYPFKLFAYQRLLRRAIHFVDAQDHRTRVNGR